MVVGKIQKFTKRNRHVWHRMVSLIIKATRQVGPRAAFQECCVRELVYWMGLASRSQSLSTNPQTEPLLVASPLLSAMQTSHLFTKQITEAETGSCQIREIRDRERVMRGLKTVETPIIPGYQIYHNYIRPHEGLDGQTPAEACGIKVGGQDKWLTLIQNASKQKS
jgi:hypothetical protein